MNVADNDRSTGHGISKIEQHIILIVATVIDIIVRKQSSRRRSRNRMNSLSAVIVDRVSFRTSGRFGNIFITSGRNKFNIGGGKFYNNSHKYASTRINTTSNATILLSSDCDGSIAIIIVASNCGSDNDDFNG